MTISMQAFRIKTFLLFSSMLPITIFAAIDTLNPNQSLTSNQTLVSADEKFELGFFSPENSKNQYLGIWFKKPYPATVVWVANREPSLLKNSICAFELNEDGVLVVLDDNKTRIWSSNKSRSVQNPVAQLLNTGNLVVREENDHDPENYLWQSMDYPSDTLLPSFKLGIVRATGLNRFLTSWKSPQDPSPGNFTYRLEPNGFPQMLMSDGSVTRYRTGPWNGNIFSGLLNNFGFVFVFNEEEVSIRYGSYNSSIVSRTTLSPEGAIQQYVWSEAAQNWLLFATVPSDQCDTYAPCGAYARCNIDESHLCGCLSGFESKFHKNWVWETDDGSSGCERKIPMDCDGDGFVKYSDVKLPDTRRSWFNTSLNLEECRMVCFKRCNCTAYANLDVRGGGSGCLLWFEDLIDIQEHAQNGQDLFIRMASSQLESSGEGGSGHRNGKQLSRVTKVLVGIVSSVLGIVVTGLVMLVYLRKKKRRSRQGLVSAKNQTEDFDLPLFDFATVATSTNNFSAENKLGEGGFGPVYKGILEEGQEIAVKRLSLNSKQGLNEFRNEVICIAKLQHRNLVKLVGCCVQEETMLLYEFMPNKSLDFFIFDNLQRKILNWQKRFHIINGIARGLLYLHQDSRLRIVHRDLKASNVLLDHEMNPKISDFGLARSFGGNETEANTKRIVGTYGYMPPEYAIDGIFSIKSDVFSYGVLVLEIVAGKKNRGFFHTDHYLNLLGHAWKLFKEGRSLELMDEFIVNSRNVSEVSRSIHVALLCVQRRPEDRPNMPSVVLMLGSESSLPEPKQPGFFTEREVNEAESLAGNQELCSVNEITQTMLSAR